LTGLDSEVDETDVDANNMTDPSIYDTSTIILPNMTLTGDYANFTDAFYDTDIDISNNTGGAEVMNSTLPDVDGTAMNATDASTAILDELSRPYTLSHELQGVAASASYGFSVAMSSDGNVLAVGAKDMTDASLGEVGAVRLYSLETSPPTLIQTLVNEYPYGEFGNSIGLSNDGNRLVVGARSENDQTGVVRVYERDSFGQWVLLGMPISGKSSGERAGWSVSISGDGSSVAVGAPKGGGSASGAVSTYRFEDGLNWAPYGTALEGVSEEAFGYATSLSYDGNLVAVGAPKAMNPEGASNAGKTSVYHLYGTEWLPLPGKELHGTSADGIDGTSIALSQDGSILVVGGKGRGNDDGVKNVGNCQIYEFGTDWELLHSMEGLTENERLGSSVAVSQNGNVVACGGEAAMYDGVGIGIVRVWNKATSMSSEVWPRNSDGGALFGSTLCLKEDGKILAVGAPGRNIVNVGKAGAVDVYEDFIN
jgi:WD40 repeat protein